MSSNSSSINRLATLKHVPTVLPFAGVNDTYAPHRVVDDCVAPAHEKHAIARDRLVGVAYEKLFSALKRNRRWTTLCVLFPCGFEVNAVVHMVSTLSTVFNRAISVLYWIPCADHMRKDKCVTGMAHCYKKLVVRDDGSSEYRTPDWWPTDPAVQRALQGASAAAQEVVRRALAEEDPRKRAEEPGVLTCDFHMLPRNIDVLFAVDAGMHVDHLQLQAYMAARGQDAPEYISVMPYWDDLLTSQGSTIYFAQKDGLCEALRSMWGEVCGGFDASFMSKARYRWPAQESEVSLGGATGSCVIYDVVTTLLGYYPGGSVSPGYLQLLANWVAATSGVKGYVMKLDDAHQCPPLDDTLRDRIGIFTGHRVTYDVGVTKSQAQWLEFAPTFMARSPLRDFDKLKVIIPMKALGYLQSRVTSDSTFLALLLKKGQGRKKWTEDERGEAMRRFYMIKKFIQLGATFGLASSSTEMFNRLNTYVIDPMLFTLCGIVARESDNAARFAEDILDAVPSDWSCFSTVGWTAANFLGRTLLPEPLRWLGRCFTGHGYYDSMYNGNQGLYSGIGFSQFRRQTMHVSVASFLSQLRLWLNEEQIEQNELSCLAWSPVHARQLQQSDCVLHALRVAGFGDDPDCAVLATCLATVAKEHSDFVWEYVLDWFSSIGLVFDRKDAHLEFVGRKPKQAPVVWDEDPAWCLVREVVEAPADMDAMRTHATAKCLLLLDELSKVSEPVMVVVLHDAPGTHHWWLKRLLQGQKGRYVSDNTYTKGSMARSRGLTVHLSMEATYRAVEKELDAIEERTGVRPVMWVWSDIGGGALNRRCRAIKEAFEWFASAKHYTKIQCDHWSKGQTALERLCRYRLWQLRWTTAHTSDCVLVSVPSRDLPDVADVLDARVGCYRYRCSNRLVTVRHESDSFWGEAPSAGTKLRMLEKSVALCNLSMLLHDETLHTSWLYVEKDKLRVTRRRARARGFQWFELRSLGLFVDCDDGVARVAVVVFCRSEDAYNEWIDPSVLTMPTAVTQEYVARVRQVREASSFECLASSVVTPTSRVVCFLATPACHVDGSGRAEYAVEAGRETLQNDDARVPLEWLAMFLTKHFIPCLVRRAKLSVRDFLQSVVVPSSLTSQIEMCERLNEQYRTRMFVPAEVTPVVNAQVVKPAKAPANSTTQTRLVDASSRDEIRHEVRGVVATPVDVDQLVNDWLNDVIGQLNRPTAPSVPSSQGDACGPQGVPQMDVESEPTGLTQKSNGRAPECCVGDVVTHDSEVLVNAANTHGQTGGGVDAAFVEAGGPGLVRERAAWLLEGLERTIEVGHFRTTGGHGTGARRIYHVVGPVVTRNDEEWYDVLFGAIRRVLDDAAREGFESVALPIVSAGAFLQAKERKLEVMRCVYNACCVDSDLLVTLVVPTQFDADLFATMGAELVVHRRRQPSQRTHEPPQVVLVELPQQSVSQGVLDCVNDVEFPEILECATPMRTESNRRKRQMHEAWLWPCCRWLGYTELREMENLAIANGFAVVVTPVHEDGTSCMKQDDRSWWVFVVPDNCAMNIRYCVITTCSGKCRMDRHHFLHPILVEWRRSCVSLDMAVWHQDWRAELDAAWMRRLSEPLVFEDPSGTRADMSFKDWGQLRSTAFNARDQLLYVIQGNPGAGKTRTLHEFYAMVLGNVAGKVTCLLGVSGMAKELKGVLRTVADRQLGTYEVVSLPGYLKAKIAMAGLAKQTPQQYDERAWIVMLADCFKESARTEHVFVEEALQNVWPAFLAAAHRVGDATRTLNQHKFTVNAAVEQPGAAYFAGGAVQGFLAALPPIVGVLYYEGAKMICVSSGVTINLMQRSSANENLHGGFGLPIGERKDLQIKVVPHNVSVCTLEDACRAYDCDTIDAFWHFLTGESFLDSILRNTLVMRDVSGRQLMAPLKDVTVDFLFMFDSNREVECFVRSLADYASRFLDPGPNADVNAVRDFVSPWVKNSTNAIGLTKKVAFYMNSWVVDANWGSICRAYEVAEPMRVQIGSDNIDLVLDTDPLIAMLPSNKQALVGMFRHLDRLLMVTTSAMSRVRLVNDFTNFSAHVRFRYSTQPYVALTTGGLLVSEDALAYVRDDMRPVPGVVEALDNMQLVAPMVLGRVTEARIMRPMRAQVVGGDTSSLRNVLCDIYGFTCDDAAIRPAYVLKPIDMQLGGAGDLCEERDDELVVSLITCDCTRDLTPALNQVQSAASTVHTAMTLASRANSIRQAQRLKKHSDDHLELFRQVLRELADRNPARVEECPRFEDLCSKFIDNQLDKMSCDRNKLEAFVLKLESEMQMHLGHGGMTEDGEAMLKSYVTIIKTQVKRKLKMRIDEAVCDHAAGKRPVIGPELLDHLAKAGQPVNSMTTLQTWILSTVYAWVGALSLMPTKFAMFVGGQGAGFDDIAARFWEGYKDGQWIGESDFNQMDASHNDENFAYVAAYLQEFVLRRFRLPLNLQMMVLRMLKVWAKQNDWYMLTRTKHYKMRVKGHGSLMSGHNATYWLNCILNIVAIVVMIIDQYIIDSGIRDVMAMAMDIAERVCDCFFGVSGDDNVMRTNNVLRVVTNGIFDNFGMSVKIVEVVSRPPTFCNQLLMRVVVEGRTTGRALVNFHRLTVALMSKPLPPSKIAYDRAVKGPYGSRLPAQHNRTFKFVEALEDMALSVKQLLGGWEQDQAAAALCEFYNSTYHTLFAEEYAWLRRLEQSGGKHYYKDVLVCYSVLTWRVGSELADADKVIVKQNYKEDDFMMQLATKAGKYAELFD